MLPPRVPLLPVELQRQVQAELRAGERQVWAAQPLPRLLRWQGVGLVLFGIPWTAFSVFWVTMAARGIGSDIGRSFGVALLFPLFGVPFVAIGVFMLTSPVWLARQARRTVYALTDQRAVVIAGRTFGGGVDVQSFDPARLTSITRRERRDGTGDLVFEQFTQRRGSGTTTVRRGFMGIADVRQVEDLIHSTLLAGRTRGV